MTPSHPTVRTILTLVALAAISSLSLAADGGAPDGVLVRGGKPVGVRTKGDAWKQTGGTLRGGGLGTVLTGRWGVGKGDFQITARLSLATLDGTAASFVIGQSHFGFDGRSKTLFTEGALFGGGVKSRGASADYITAGKAFDFEVTRRSGKTAFRIDGKTLVEITHAEPIDSFGFRPHRGEMRITDFTVKGDLVETPEPPKTTDLFVSGKGGYHTYRIPAIVVTTKGTVLAFCEGRKSSRSDAGNIDMILRRSTDMGKTWSTQRVIWDDGGNTCGNPCPVVDRTTGTVWLLMTWNSGVIHEGRIKAGLGTDSRRVFVCSSADDGLTWSKPVNITAATKKPEWSWYATGPCNGIQLTKGPRAGRLVIPCDNKTHSGRDYYSHVVYSDDGGQTWQIGGASPSPKTNECTVVELTDGSLMLNMRNYDRRNRCRAVCTSPDAGATWKDLRWDTALPEPICQASILRHAWPAKGAGDKGVILFANPASPSGRQRMTVRASRDDGKTWPASLVLHGGSSAYSCLVNITPTQIGCLFEADGYARITLSTFTLDELK